MRGRSSAEWAVTVGSAFCPQCSKKPVGVARASLWNRIRHWFNSGAPVPDTMTCADGHEWSGGSVSRLRVYRSRPGWPWLPVSLFRMVNRHRSMQAVPRTYVMAAVVGALLGGLVELLVGWSWWLAAFAFIAAVWLFFLSSAFWGHDPVRADDIRGVIDPQGIRGREFARLDKAVSEGQLIGMEVDGWTGSRSLGGWAGSDVPEELTLRHGDPQSDEEWVIVTTRCGRRALMGLEERKIAVFEQLLWDEVRQPPDLDRDGMHSWRVEQERRIEGTKMTDWSTIMLMVDGDAVPCDVYQAADRWAAVCAVGPIMIELLARGIDVDSVALRRVSDLQRYFDDT